MSPKEKTTADQALTNTNGRSAARSPFPRLLRVLVVGSFGCRRSSCLLRAPTCCGGLFLLAGVAG